MRTDLSESCLRVYHGATDKLWYIMKGRTLRAETTTAEIIDDLVIRVRSGEILPDCAVNQLSRRKHASRILTDSFRRTSDVRTKTAVVVIASRLAERGLVPLLIEASTMLTSSALTTVRTLATTALMSYVDSPQSQRGSCERSHRFPVTGHDPHPRHGAITA